MTTMMNSDMVSVNSGSGAIHEPRELDILVGKETKARNHKGSRCFRLFVESYRRRYQDAKNKHKRASITREMYDTITQASIRFLKFNDERGGWEEITSTEARDKITHALRFAQKKRRRQKGGSSKSGNLPQRQGSDSTHRSETSTTSATSLDWDHLWLQQQQHLAGASPSSGGAGGGGASAALSLSNMNASLRACRQARRSSFSSVGSASLLSRGEDSISRDSRGTNHSHTPRVSFSAVTESTIYSADLSASVTTVETASVVSVSTATDPHPLPVDLSSTQHLDMHQSQASLSGDVEHVDRPPRMPSRPTEEDEIQEEEEEEDEEEDWGEDVLKSAGIDTLMNSSHTGFDCLLDPLMEIDHERGADSSDSSKDGAQSLFDEEEEEAQKPAAMEQPSNIVLPPPNNLPTNMALMTQLDQGLANLRLETTTMGMTTTSIAEATAAATTTTIDPPSLMEMMPPFQTVTGMPTDFINDEEAPSPHAAISEPPDPELTRDIMNQHPFSPTTAFNLTADDEAIASSDNDVGMDSGAQPLESVPEDHQVMPLVNIVSQEGAGTSGDYSMQLMQEPLFEWWKPADTV